jgi:hypothetical protein
MNPRRFTSLSAMIAVFVLTASAGAQEKKDKPANKNRLDDDTNKLLATVEEAVKAHDYRKDPKHGDGRTPYEEVKPGLLVGFDLYGGVRDKTTTFVRGVKPVWLTKDGTKLLGKTAGWVVGGSGLRVEAKPGYAVAGMKVHTDFGELAGVLIVFAKITENGLDMSDSYESKYFGHNDPNTARKVVCTGEPIVGIHGLVADSAKSHDFGLGLVVMGKEEGKKKKK